MPPPTRIRTWKDTLENLTALGNLARTCKTLEQLTTPMLFERVEVSVFAPASFVQLIRHFSRFGHLATHVRYLTLGSVGDPSTLSASQASFLLQEGQRLGLKRLPERLDLSDPVEPRSMLIDVLLCQVLTIRKLVISLPQHLYLQAFVSPRVLSYAARLPDSFTLGSLREIEAHSIDPELSADSFERASLTALIRLAPALTHLRVGFCDGTAPQGIIQSPLPELQDLHLFEGMVEDLTAVAKFCPRLQRCRLGAGVATEPSKGQFYRGLYFDAQSNPHSPLNALLPLSATLHDLDVNPSGLLVLDIRALPYLAPFTALRSLRWTFYRWPDGDNTALLDKLLTPALESLCLGGPEMPVYDIAVLLHERVRSGRFPGLRRFQYLLVSKELEPGVADSIVSLFEGTGVTCGPAVGPEIDKLRAGMFPPRPAREDE
ncbi:hypothetical protein NEMBOFW57_000354 [Staphylotrichum longicolle]|uniref:F-box domain-containing protein n=1 Tax=Staphylotrichum longicolle TaxID=669026 RepID=A0AAD4EZG4_9PEZI|nr:hypothetical protein NEMBOFW57_000354 [Staphylotrichum longicolle]